MNGISSVGNRVSLAQIQPPGRVATGEKGFYDRLKTAVKDVNNRQIIADESTQQVIQGKLGIHEGMLKIQEADISLRLLIQVRGKAMEAYKEIIKMPI
ncbi:MAG: flagellar hook-basal body complex protein FliE [Desulfobacteraceae bacterium 4572_19]|nr:MAG: flagellar hook-basal body complex protein FliE [Desulfobacteraceae bacterium 4572_19]